jgi:hypothetical protein
VISADTCLTNLARLGQIARLAKAWYKVVQAQPTTNVLLAMLVNLSRPQAVTSRVKVSVNRVLKHTDFLQPQLCQAIVCARIVPWGSSKVLPRMLHVLHGKRVRLALVRPQTIVQIAVSSKWPRPQTMAHWGVATMKTTIAISAHLEAHGFRRVCRGAAHVSQVILTM